MNYKEKLEANRIPKALISELSAADPSEVSRFLRNPRLVSDAKKTRIEQAISDVSDLVENFSPSLPPGVGLNFKNAFEIRRLIFLRRSDVSSILSGDAATS